MRYFLAILAASIVAVVGILGCRGTHFRKPPLYIYPDMERQLKLRPQKPNEFFANGISSQLPVPGTIARSASFQTANGTVFAFEDAPFNTGLAAGTARQVGVTNFVELSPIATTAEVLARGRQRYGISCSPCHGGLGDGNGITKKIGAMAVVANLHDRRIVEMTDGELFYVITHGRGLMGAYGPSVTVPDRWAIVAYVRALQTSWLGTVEDLPEVMRASLK
jgi:mono/diheme cytochrome c family protein